MKRNTHKIDAEGKAIGRLASEAALLLRGKNKPDFTPHIDAGDIVEVLNAAKVKITGNKLINKIYYSYSGYPGGMKSKNLKTIMEKDPGEAIRRAVRKMLPANRLRDGMMKRLIVK